MTSARTGASRGRLSDTSFLLAVAFAMVALRLFVFDGPRYFLFNAIPSHDLYQGAGMFCSSMHSVRISGEIAWWNPADPRGGVAQYFNAFLSPLAPTNGHLVFIVWAQVIWVLASLGIAIPEYVQYLSINLIVFPFLTYLFLARVCLLLFRDRPVTWLIVIIYAFSGLGLWNSAWFYYQESATLFLVLSCVIAALVRPSPARGIELLCACLVQLASMNYWTVFNSWFVIVFVGSYLAFHPIQMRRAAARMSVAVRRSPGRMALLLAPFLITGVLWTCLIASVVIEQAGVYRRQVGGPADQQGFSSDDALEEARALRKRTVDLFNPRPRRALHSGQTEMHNARYIGAMLVPFLVLAFIGPWTRRERWLMAFATIQFAVCFVPGWLLAAWSMVPFMNQIRHQFYFNGHYLQLAGVLIACNTFGRVRRREYSKSLEPLWIRAAAAVAGGAGLAIAILGTVNQAESAEVQAMEAGLFAWSLILLTSLFLLHALRNPTAANHRMLTAMMLFLAVSDLTRYYWHVSRIDESFTSKRRYGWEIPNPLPPEVRAAMRSPWRFDIDRPDNLFANLPIRNHLWPSNEFNTHRWVKEWETSGEKHKVAAPTPFVEFSRQEPDSVRSSRDPGSEGPIPFRIVERNYNEIFGECTSSAAGWLILDCLADPNWRVRVNGQDVWPQRASGIRMSIPVDAGAHRIEMRYRPLSRSLYEPACWALEGTLLFAWLMVFRGDRTERHAGPKQGGP